MTIENSRFCKPLLFGLRGLKSRYWYQNR